MAARTQQQGEHCERQQLATLANRTPARSIVWLARAARRSPLARSAVTPVGQSALCALFAGGAATAAAAALSQFERVEMETVCAAHITLASAAADAQHKPAPTDTSGLLLLLCGYFLPGARRGVAARPQCNCTGRGGRSEPIAGAPVSGRGRPAAARRRAVTGALARF